MYNFLANSLSWPNSDVAAISQSLQRERKKERKSLITNNFFKSERSCVEVGGAGVRRVCMDVGSGG